MIQKKAEPIKETAFFSFVFFCRQNIVKSFEVSKLNVITKVKYLYNKVLNLYKVCIGFIFSSSFFFSSFGGVYE
jgi:hypothetical protein